MSFWDQKGLEEERLENKQAQAGGSATLVKAVVVDNFVFPDMLTQEQVNDLLTITANKDVLGPVDKDGNVVLPLDIPRNTLLLRNITPGEDKKYFLSLPLFPPHLVFPIQPGEQVWAIREKPGEEKIYWITRIPGNVFTDDINYTHLDRIKGLKTTPTSRDAFFEAKGMKDKYLLPDFLNGDGVGLKTLAAEKQPPGPKIEMEDDYDAILEKAIERYKAASATQAFVHEPVPRFTKRPGDFIIQGSNNALISLGTDRGWTAAMRPSKSNAMFQETKPFSGTVDIVAGRGRWLPLNATTNMAEGDAPKDTAPPTINNQRGNVEVTKNIEVNEIPTNDSEGDPDFLHDSSRIYVSMNTNPDTNFDTTSSTGKLFDGDLPKTENSAAVVMKSDHVRVIARKLEKDAAPGSPEIKGSIQIIKEGKPGDDAASIIIQPDGSIHIKGPQIYFTDAETAKGKGEGPGKSEPYMRFSDFKEYMNNTIDLIIADMEALQSDIKKVADGLASAHFLAPSIPAPGPPIPLIPGPMVMGEGFLPGIINLKLPLGGDYAVSAMKGTTTAKDKAMDKIKSEKIFGE